MRGGAAAHVAAGGDAAVSYSRVQRWALAPEAVNV
jgi:hypothetical protein